MDIREFWRRVIKKSHILNVSLIDTRRLSSNGNFEKLLTEPPEKNITCQEN